MKILITGASGFLGSWFLDHFIRESGHDVWMVDIQPHPTGIPVDQEDMGSWLEAFDEDVDVAFHFAAPVGGRMKIEHDPMYNADAFRLDSAFFRWAVKHAKLAVYPSSSAVYPISLQTGAYDYPLVEDIVSPKHDAWSAPDELYGMTKLAGEYMAWKAAEKHDLDVLCIRPFSGYGPGQSPDYPMPAILRRVIDNERPLVVWGSGKQVRDFVYVTDIVDATLQRIDDGVSGYEVMNIASGIPVDFTTVAQIASDLRDQHPDIIPDPSRPEGVKYRVGSPDRMNRYWKPKISLRDGIANTMEWLETPRIDTVLSEETPVEAVNDEPVTSDAS